MDPEDVRSVGVVGAGIMGSGIVEVCAKAGLEVALVERGRRTMERSMARAVERGKLDEAGMRDALARVHGHTDLADLATVDLVVEAVVEDVRAKQGIFERLDELVRPEVALATNTSSVPIVELAAVTKRPDRVVGMHFFNPPPVMKLLEIVRAITTSDETVAVATGMAARLGKTAIVAKDRAGFIVNLLLVPYLNNAVRMLEDGFATREDIDAGITLGLGHPMGPLTLADLIGLDTALHVAEVLYEEFKDPQFSPPPLLRRMVTAGRLGRKTGRGFYEYP
jgi:3-hydroxybutyryl-CoA dehydrogenase